VTLAGESSAGSAGVLDFAFVAVSPASALTIAAVEPVGFGLAESVPLLAGGPVQTSLGWPPASFYARSSVFLTQASGQDLIFEG